MFSFVFASKAFTENVEIYDIKTNKVKVVPKESLGSEMVRIRLGDKIYWADVNQLTKNTYQHPPFKGERKQRIINIMSSLKEVYSMTYKKWEDGFRRDKNPDSEIKIWEHIVSEYLKFKKGRNINEKKDILYTILTCSNSQKDSVLQQFKPKHLSINEAKIIIDSYFKISSP